MTQEEMEINIEHLLKCNVIVSEWMTAHIEMGEIKSDAEAKLNAELINLISNQADTIEALKNGGQGLLKAQEMLAASMEKLAVYLEAQQKCSIAHFNDYVDSISKLTNSSTIDTIKRIEDNYDKNNPPKTKLFVVRD